MTGWGESKWGESPWGSGLPLGGPPLITPLEPIDQEAGVSRSKRITIRFTDAISVSASRANVSVNSLIWVLGGVGVNGAAVETVPNGGNGFDMIITPPSPYAANSRQEVLAVVENTQGQLTSLTYWFYVGIGLRILRVDNPFENTLAVYFNRAMQLNASFFQPANWIITPVSPGARSLTVTRISANANRSDAAQLQYAGGGSTYRLTPVNIVDLNGDGFEDGYESILFEILFGDEEEPTIKLFDSVFGPLGISQRVRTRRSMDDHVSNRAIALALDEQFRLRMQRLDATVGRDGRDGKRRT